MLPPTHYRRDENYSRSERFRQIVENYYRSVSEGKGIHFKIERGVKRVQFKLTEII